MNPKTPQRIPEFLWRWMKPLNQRLARNFSSRSRASRLVLVLTTRGRKSGLLRRTPLQYEEIDGVYYVASARGVQADWYRNILANPNIEIQIQDRRLPARAEAISDQARIADFLEIRLQRHPRMVGAMLRLEGLASKFDRTALEEFAAGKALVAIYPN
jgi:deazaflavin-dependent oxidoreductase (nitroreductase family)